MEEAAEEAFGSAFAEEAGEASEEELETFKDLDLSSVLEEKVEPATPSAGGAVDIDDIPSILASFRDKVHEQIGEDAGAYFDLGIAYKEMGLLDDAIGSFRSALKAGANPTECLHMIALCFVDKGELNKAEAVLREGLKEENLKDEEKMILEYELGVVLEEEGRLNEALELLKDVRRMKKDFREVVSIIIRLEERIGVAESKPAPPTGRDKISYI
jgi:tetratricopeptide (TPR) repeat protein